MMDDLQAIWEEALLWWKDDGIGLAIVLLAILLVPRIGRFALHLITVAIENSNEDADEAKAHLALTGVGIYVAQLFAYFVLSFYLLQALGFTTTSAAVPATVLSAAIGFGAQSVIADFLAGFFVLSERQYGVGDWVRFEGNGVKVEGTVLKITMRATRIRTLADEAIIIPNSTARICINASNTWSRAVVAMPVPLLGSASVDEAIERTSRAADRALARPEIAPLLLDEIQVQPATQVSPPSTVGMPWLMTVRLMVKVSPGNQWIVERAIRTAILDEFWSEYGSATTTTGIPRRGADAGEDGEATRLPSADLGGRDDEHLEIAEEPKPKRPLFLHNDAPRDPVRRVLSFGGRVRPSTPILLILLLVLLAVQLKLGIIPDLDVSPDTITQHGLRYLP